MPDQMPGASQPLDHGRLRLPFLNPVFTEMTDARVKSFADSFRRERFGYAYEGDGGSFAPRPSGGLFDALLEGGDILCHNALRCSHSADSSRVARLVVNRVPHRTQSRMPAPIPIDPPTICQI